MSHLKTNGKDQLENQGSKLSSGSLGELQREPRCHHRQGSLVPGPAREFALGFRKFLRYDLEGSGDASDAFHTWLMMMMPLMVVMMIREMVPSIIFLRLAISFPPRDLGLILYQSALHTHWSPLELN